MRKPIAPRERLIVALDLAPLAEAEAMIARLGETVAFYKIGLELACAGGLPLAERLVAAGKRVFLDLKFHDIPNTVERATAQVARLGVDLLTVHAYPQTMAAAHRGAAGSRLQLLAVTVLTSCDDADLAEAGFAMTTRDLVARRCAQAVAAGIAGIVLSPEEVAATRAALGPDVLLVTPGIRPADSAASDQKRVTSAAEAIRAGADYLVVGRPITQAADPVAAAQAMVDEIASAA
jgi:orotidine-5'-phosphate decarboxylase